MFFNFGRLRSGSPTLHSDSQALILLEYAHLIKIYGKWLAQASKQANMHTHAQGHMEKQETETGNGNWKRKLETEMGTKNTPITWCNIQFVNRE